MSISDDDLRAALRSYADVAGPARFDPEPVIRKARRRRARFVAAAAGGAVAVVAAAAVLSSGAGAGVHGSRQYVPMIGPGPAGHGPWPTSFSCGQQLPTGLPGSAGYALRVSVGPVTRSESGRPTVVWYEQGTEAHHAAPELGHTDAVVLVVRDDGTIVAVLRGPGPSMRSTRIPLVEKVVSASRIRHAEPLISLCHSVGWSQMWAHHQQYGIAVLTTAWVGYPGGDPARFGAAAALPSS